MNRVTPLEWVPGKALLAGLMLLVPVLVSASPFEAAPTLEARDTLGEKALSGKHYLIQHQVINDGLMNRYQIRSSIQDMQAYGDALALERAHEIDAIVVLREIKESDAYTKGLDAALQAPIALTKSVIEDPVGTLQKLPGGLSNLLDDVGAAVSGIGKGGENKENNAMFKDLIGFNTVKRRLASELGVDPYSTNTLLKQELNDVAWSMFAGGAPINIALAIAPMAASVTVRIADNMDSTQIDWKIPPATLRQAGINAAMAMGLSEQEAEQVMHHPKCSIRHQSVMISALTDLGDAAGRDGLLREFIKADSDLACRKNRQTAELIWLYHHNVSPIAEITLNQGLVTLKDIKGVQVVPLRADYLAMTQSNAGLFNALKQLPPNSVLWLSGGLSNKSRKTLEAQGMIVQEHVASRHKQRVEVVKVLLPERQVNTSDEP